jgi:DNA-nicking Smr family endonuclease
MGDDKSRGTPRLSDEDRSLWERVARSAKPLARKSARLAPSVPVVGRQSAAPARETAQPAAAAQRPSMAAKPPRVSPLPKTTPATRLDRRTVQRLSRGTISLDGRLDLHGLTQSAAHHRLLGFLQQSQRANARMVLVITGKGGTKARSAHGMSEHTGVLRRAVPQWLRTPEFSVLVVGYDAAGPAHGGSGALYVRLRRRPGTKGSN